MSTHPIIPSATKKKRADFDLVASKPNSTALPPPVLTKRGTVVPLKDTKSVSGFPETQPEKVLGKEGMTYQAIADKSGVADETVRKSVSEIEFSISEVTNARGQKRPSQYKKLNSIFANGGVTLIVIGRPCELNYQAW